MRALGSGDRLENVQSYVGMRVRVMRGNLASWVTDITKIKGIG